MNHYVKIGLAVCGGIIGAEIVKGAGKRIASAVANAAARVAASDNNETEDAPAAEAPKPETKKPADKAPDKKDGQGKKDDKKPADGKQDNNGKKGDKKPETAGKK
jgi:sRNA-binding protein